MVTNLVENLITLIAAGAGLWFLIRGLARLCLPVPESSWIAVEGTMKESGVDENGDNDGPPTYSVKLLYEYNYRGINYINDRIAPLQMWSSFRSTADSYARKYPRDRQVTVYVNPHNPGTAVLEPGRQIIAALCYSLIGATLCTMAWMSTWMH